VAKNISNGNQDSSMKLMNIKQEKNIL